MRVQARSPHPLPFFSSRAGSDVFGRAQGGGEGGREGGREGVIRRSRPALPSRFVHPPITPLPPSRHCRGARVYGDTSTAMHGIEYITRRQKMDTILTDSHLDTRINTYPDKCEINSTKARICNRSMGRERENRKTFGNSTDDSS